MRVYPKKSADGCGMSSSAVGGKSNIVLIGMSGAGKSTLGVLLAKALGKDFVDSDIVIQQRENRMLQDILDQDGIERFLKTEEAVLSTLDVHHSVIATGGSAVYSSQAMTALQRDGIVVYLSVPYLELEKRLTNITTRGIVMRPGGSLREVFEERLPLYLAYSEITVDCSGENVEACVEAIVTALPKTP